MPVPRPIRVSSKKRVLVACEFSGILREAFRSLGYEAWSCDLLPSEIPSRFHYQGDIADILNCNWEILIAHPPCQYLCNSGVRWLKEQPGRVFHMEQACDFFSSLLKCGIPRICIENPIMHGTGVSRIGEKHTQLIQPWQFGHKEMKATCLWLKNLPNLKPTDVVGPPPKNPEERKLWAKVHRASPGPDRWKIRSRTYQGIADAMAKQWGVFLNAEN